MRFGTQALVAAVRQSTVPWCAVMVRKAFGMAGRRSATVPRFLRYAWPSAAVGLAADCRWRRGAYRAVIEAAPDPAAKRAEIETRSEADRRSAEAFGVEEIIDPPKTRVPVPLRPACRAPAHPRA